MKTTSISSMLVFFFILMFTHTVSAQSDTYHLIVGSYDNFDLADQKIKELAQKGFDAITVFPNDNKKRFRVSLYHSKNRKEVAAYQTMVKGQGVKDGWIYTEKPRQAINSSTTTSPSASVPSPFRNVPRRDETTKTVERSVIDQNITYHLIVGSFNDMASADNYGRELEGKGFEAVILSPDKISDKFRVSLYFTKNKNEIDAYASSVKRQGKVKGWIYEEHKDDGTNIIAISKAVSVVPKRQEMYYLVAASFVSHTDAMTHAAKLSKSGMSPTVLLPQSGETARYRVSIYQSANKADVVAYQRDLKSKGKDTGWILN